MSKTALGFVTCALLLAVTAAGFSADKTFTGASGDWSTAGSWNPSGSPQVFDSAFVNNAGTVTVSTTGQVCNTLWLANGSLSVTTGALNANDLLAGVSGTGSVTHSGGTVALNSSLSLGTAATFTGQYALSNASVLQSVDEYVGDFGIGSFTQSGTASNTLSGWMYMGKSAGSSGTYTMNAGTLSAVNNLIGYGGTGAMTQAAGTTTVTDQFQIGSLTGSIGTYNLNGGSVSAYDLLVGSAGTGTLSIGSAAASATVSHMLSFGKNGKLQAVAGSSIHLGNSSVQNASTTVANLNGLQNLTMYFGGNATLPSMLEVACTDIGSSNTGYTGNFSLGGLNVGDGAFTGYVKLVDDVANQGGSEALYVKNLVVTAGSTLDLNGIKLYYDTLTVATGATINGTATHVGATLIPGDFNGDGIVNFRDYIILEGNFGETNATFSMGDANGDTVVTFKDYIILEANFNKSSVPEPTTIGLLIAGGLALLRRKA